MHTGPQSDTFGGSGFGLRLRRCSIPREAVSLKRLKEKRVTDAEVSFENGTRTKVLIPGTIEPSCPPRAPTRQRTGRGPS